MIASGDTPSLKSDYRSKPSVLDTETIARIQLEKAELRKRLLRMRGEIPPSARAQKSLSIQSNILLLCQRYSPGLIHIFLPFGDEPEIRPLMGPLRERGFHLVVPVISSEGLLLAPLEPQTALYPGPFGILEPRNFNPLPVDGVTLYLLPGVAFDRNGGRLGYGKGYYDRLLSRCPAPRFGVSFDEQVVDSVPLTENDILVDGVITDKEIVYRD
ncbi:MAG: 5-formyltetrahydrofolate cyclo-ligase [Leptospirales bacterium]